MRIFKAIAAPLFAGLALAGLLAAPCWGEPDCRDLQQPAARQGVLRTEELWVAALEKNDRAFLACLLSPGFTDIDWQGHLRTRRDVLESQNMPAMAIHLTAMQVGLHGDVATVRGLNVTGRPDHPVRIRFTDVFFYRRGGWRAVLSQETLEQP